MTLPHPSEQVEVVIADGTAAAARVMAPDEDTVRLSWLKASHLADGPATLHFTHRRGILSVSGQLTQDGEGLASFRPDGPATLVQRRDAVRVDLLAPVRWDGATGHVLNLGVGGFLMQMRAPLAVGETLRFTLELPDGGEPLEVSGEIRRSAGDDQWGVRMRELTAREEDRLVRLIFVRQRLALRMTRDG